MSGNQSSLVVTGNTAAVIPGVTIRSGETFTAGDTVALDYQGQAIKCGALSSLTIATFSTLTDTLLGVYEIALDVFIIAVANSTGPVTTFYWYNRSSNTVTASPTVALNVGAIQDVRVLGSGEVVLLFTDATNQYLAKYSGAGVSVYAPVTVAAVSTFGFSGMMNFLMPSSVSGEVMIGTFAVTTYLMSAKHYNTSGTLQGGTTATASGNNNAAMKGLLTATGGGFILAVFSTDNTNLYAYLINATTRAVVLNSVAFTVNLTYACGITWDATNSQFVVFGSSSTGAQIHTITTAGTITNVQNTGTYGVVAVSAAMLSPTTMYGFGAAVYIYSTAGGGTVTETRVTQKASPESIVAGASSGWYATNFGLQDPTFKFSKAGMTLSYVALNDSTYGTGYYAFTINPATGVATPLFSLGAQAPLVTYPAARSGQRYEISVLREYTNPGTGANKIVLRRADAGVVYGVAKKVTATTVDIDTSNFGTGGDMNLTAMRSHRLAFANNTTYAIGA